MKTFQIACEPCGRRFFAYAVFPLILALLAPAALAQGEEPAIQAGVVVVQLAPGVSIANKAARTGLQDFDRRAARYDVHLVERAYPFLDHVQPTPRTRRNLMALRRTYYVRFRAGTAPDRVSADLAAAPGVVYAEPVPVTRTQALDIQEQADPDDPRFGEQTYLRHLRLPEAWDAVRSEDGVPQVVIAIVDGGGEWRHEDLRANVWTNPDEIVGNGIDDDGNGFIDDVHGVNFANGDDMDNDPTGLPQTPWNAWHGTAAAGAAGAVTDNRVGIAGSAWNARIMHVNAGCSNSDGRFCYAYAGILYAAANGADIINASFSGLAGGGARSRFLDESLDLATDLGALVVASASDGYTSNDLLWYYPARHPRVLSVGATEKDSRQLAAISNYGKLVNVFAPGISILSTGSDNGYITVGGTSYSSPLTAGVAALVKTRFPDMTPDAIREQVRLSSENMDTENPGLAEQLGRGFVNALAAIREPAVPAVRVKRWSWSDRDGNGRIESGDSVTLSATVVNHLVDARQLRLGLRGAEPYSFIDMSATEVDVGRLDSGDSARVAFEFRIASSAPDNLWARFFLRIGEGAFVDEADMFSLPINLSLNTVHRTLSAFYTSTGGDNWTRNDNWDITTVPSESELSRWYGTQLIDGLLVGLVLPHNNLTGVLPFELGNLSHLQRLELQGNSLTGVIPSELGNLSQLQHLNLVANGLTGVIPSELGSLTQLRWLGLARSALTGEIPPELGNLTQLQALWLDGNSLTGEIPAELGHLTQLSELNLHRNSLTGEVPSWLGNLPRLRWLGLAHNGLTGEIPPELGGLSQLSVLWLGDNALTGEIPPELGNLSQLSNLILDGNALTGEIPPELGNLTQLWFLVLHGNALTGEIPPELGNLTQLYELNLADNSLTGAVPPELGNFPRLQRLHLDGNRLTGMLPRSLMQLDNPNFRLFYFDGQALCAPADDAFQEWLGGIVDVRGPTCGTVQFAGGVSNRTFTINRPVASLVLPEATGGATPYTYALEPALPAGLVFDDSLRTIRGTPTTVTPAASYSYSATDYFGISASLTFTAEVVPAISFGDLIADLTFARAQPITPLVFPEAAGGAVPLAYALTPALPAGLEFDATVRILTGTPTVVTDGPTSYTYSATGANGSSDSLQFTLEVFSPVAAEHESLPESFTVHGNYPNPFRQSTRLVFDLPWPASVTVEVMDITGRRVLAVPVARKAAGWKHIIPISGHAMSSGLYLYRLTASSPEGISVYTGRFVRIR